MGDQIQIIPLVREPAGLMTNSNLLLLPEGASVSCPETDMSGHTLQKRRGCVKFLNRRTPDVGVFLNNPDDTERQFLDVSGWGGGEVNPWDLSAHSDWTIEISTFHASLPRIGETQDILVQTDLSLSIHGWTIRVIRSTTGPYRLSCVFTDDVGGVYIVSDTNYNPGNISHIAIVANSAGDTLKLYINGAEIDSVDITGITWRVPDGNDRVWCGADPDFLMEGGGKPFNGHVSEIRLWSVARSEAEVLANYDKELDPDDADWSNLECYLKCDEGQGGLLHDSSQNGRPGFFHKGAPIPTAGLLTWDQERRGLLFNGFHYGKATLTTAAAGDPFESIRAGGKEWTVEFFMQCWGNAHTGVALPNELGILQFGDGTSPLIRIWIEDTINAHQINAQMCIAGPTAYTLTSAWEPINGAPAHIVLRRIQNTVELIVNGISQDTDTPGNNAGFTVGAAAATNALYVGWDNVAGHDNFIGTIDELRVWDHSRTDEQLDRWAWRRLRDARDDENRAGLLGYWPMDRTQLSGEDCISLCDTRKQVDATDTFPMALVFATMPNDFDESYLAGWGRSTVKRRSPAQVRAIGQHQSAVPQGQFFRGSSAPLVARSVYAQSGASLCQAMGDRWDFVAGGMDADRPASFTTVGGFLVAASGVGPNMKVDGIEAASPVGIRVPAAAPTAASGVAGNPNGDYRYAYRYKNSRTGHVSLLSSRSSEINLENEIGTVTFTSMPTDTQVDRIQVYRTIGSPDDSATSPIYFIDEVDTSSATYSDDTADSAVGDILDDNNVMAPPCRYCTTYKNLLVMAGNADNPNTVYVSKASNFEAVGQEYEIGQDDGFPVTALWVYNGVLYVGKERGVYALQGDSPTGLSVTATWPDRGVVSHQSVVPYENMVAFVDYDGIYAFNGVQFQKLSEPIDDSFNGETQHLNARKLSLTCAAAYPGKRQLWFSAHYGDPELNYGDLVGLWKLNQNPTSDGGYEARDSSKHGNHMSSVGTMTAADLVAGPYGPETALEFDGNDDFVQLVNDEQTHGVRGAASYGIWVKLNTLGSDQILMAEYDSSINTGTMIYYSTGSDAWIFFVAGGGLNAASTSGGALGEWIFLVGTFDGSYIRIWINGVLEATTAMTNKGSALIHQKPLRIGAGNNVGVIKWPINGAASQAFVSKTVLQASQIAAIYRHGKAALAGTRQYARQHKTFIYHYDTGKWTESAKGYSALALVETAAGQQLLGADGRTLVYALETGTVDGDDKTRTLSGIVTDSGARSLTCVNATFSTDQDGLSGLVVRLIDSSGDVWQTRKIVSNTATVLTVDEDWSPGAVTGYEFVVGGIEWSYRTSPLHGGNISREKTPKMFSIAQVANDARSLRDDLGYSLALGGIWDTGWLSSATLPPGHYRSGTPTLSRISSNLPPDSSVMYAVRIETDTATQGILSDLFTVVVGREYVCRFWAKTASADGDTGLVRVDSYPSYTILGQQLFDGTAWTRYSFTFTATEAQAQVAFEESEADNITDFYIAEMLILPQTLPSQTADTDYTDLPVDQTVRIRVRANVAGDFVAETDAELTDDYVRVIPTESRGRIIEYEFSNRYPGQPVDIMAVDLDVAGTEAPGAP